MVCVSSTDHAFLSWTLIMRRTAIVNRINRYSIVSMVIIVSVYIHSVSPLTHELYVCELQEHVHNIYNMFVHCT